MDGKSYLVCALAGLLILVQENLVCSQTGVFIEFKGNRLNSSSVVRLTDIGEQPSDPASQNDTVRGDALVCVTDNIACCRTVDGADVMGDGSWLFPNGDEVPGIGGSATNMGIYRNRGTSLVRLNRQADSTQMTTGDYCCEVPDREGDTQRVCVNVVISVSTTTHTSSTTGPTAEPMTFTEPTSGLVTTKESTSESSFTTSTTQTGTESLEVLLNACSATNNDLVGVIIFLCIVIVILIIAFITAICCIFRIRRNVSSTKHTQDNFEMLVDIQKTAHDVINPDDVPLKQNQAYGEVNRGRTERSEDSEAIPEYEDIRDIVHHTDDATIQRDLPSGSRN